MKKIITVIVLFIGLNAMAQRSERKDIDPEAFAQKNTERLTKELGLNEDQQAKVYDINLRNAQERTSKMEERKSGERKKPTEEEREARKTEMEAQLNAHKEEMKAILNKEQFQKWETMQEKRGNGKRGAKKMKS
ncbi:DUF4890 domain-containing protein [Cellulophaga sp. L1A9]|uniref:DUF4890 domain-containing protein n=1 Tax=Cellulophaga sp. L1A9 TaxID=2686362 RepID=UPI00131D5667|nr:DUF4890 domain-containing protein [Cellulophaga sp. L1A9]